MSCYNTATHRRLQRVLCRLCKLYRPRSKTANRALQALLQLFAVFCRCRVAGASSYTAPPAPRRTLYRAAQPSYYNKVYKGAAVRTYYRSMPDSAADRRPCQPGGVSMLPTVQGRSAWHTPPGGAVQQQGRGAAGGTIDGYRRISFRAFAR